MAFKQKNHIEEIELLKNHQVQQHDLQSKLRMSEKTRLELLSSLCESEASIKKLKKFLEAKKKNKRSIQKRLVFLTKYKEKVF
jgi:hypothetical protein